jgi:hypothetical protein
MTKHKSINEQYQTPCLVTFFQGQFHKTYNKPYVTKASRDLLFMKKLRLLFIKHESKLGDLKTYISLFLEKNKNNPIELSYILKDVNERLGVTRKVKEKKKQRSNVDAEEAELLKDKSVQEWIKSEQEKWHKKLY